MRISVAIPARNGEEFLLQALESVAGQTRRPDELLLVDDASTDRTRSIAESSRWGGQVRYVRNDTSTGFANAWNRCVRLSSGDFVVLLHQDDLLAPTHLWHIEKALECFPRARHSYTGCSYINADGLQIGTTPTPHKAEPVLYTGREYASRYIRGVEVNKHIHRCPGVATARSLVIEECPYRREAGLIADDDFFLRVGAFTDVVGISLPLACYRIHPGSVVGQERSLFARLARDYLYQVRSYAQGLGILGPGDVVRIQRLAVRFLNLLLFESIANRQRRGVSEAVALKQEMDSLHPGLFPRLAKRWGRILWRVNGGRAEASFVAFSLVKVLQIGMRSRDAVSGALEASSGSLRMESRRP